MKTNTEIQKDVMDELAWDPRVSDEAHDIGVSATDGVVTLSGLVDSYAKKLAAERAAQSVNGVKVIASELEVRTRAPHKRTDTEIAEAIRNALRWNSVVNEEGIKVKVDDGWVTLEGEVEWAYQRAAAERSIELLTGVKRVTNLMTVKARADIKDIKHRITAAFHRSATVDSSSIKLETNGTRLTLRGTVRSYAEKKEAERIAWSSPGVLSVDNRIDIDTEIFA